MDRSTTFAINEIDSAANSKASIEPRWLPGLLIVSAYWIVFWPIKALTDNNFLDFPAHLIAPMGTALLFMIAWLGFSRRSWGERLSGLGTFLVTFVVAIFVCDRTMYLALLLNALPMVLLSWSLWDFATRKQPSLTHRRVTLSATMFVTAIYFCLLRLDDIDGASCSTLSWRWTSTAEQRFLDSLKTSPTSTTESAAEENHEITLRTEDWPGFRGPNRDGVVHGVHVNADWSKHAPEVVWQQAIGPGWSSMAIVSNRLFTQEQRGDYECVTCYDTATGAEVWCHRNATRHADPISGAGPRATPQFAHGKLFAQGANGHLFCLDAATGSEIWQANIKSDSQAEIPKCGFSGSPLVMDGVVITIPGSTKSASIVAYRETDGSVAWKAGTGDSGYASAHPAELLGRQQVITLTNEGALSVDAQLGQILWRHQWSSTDEAPITQPLIIDSSRVVIPAGKSMSPRLVKLQHDTSKWSVAELWTSNEFRPYFNDFVMHGGHAYGFDGTIFCCIDLTTGKRCWKKGRYGRGQVLLLAEQALLLIICETGEVVLLEANIQTHTELARISIMTSKTWTHPAIVRDRLYVRNGEQLACIKLPAGEDRSN